MLKYKFSHNWWKFGFSGSNERSHRVEFGIINLIFQKWKFFEIWHIKKNSEICGARKVNIIKENGTFRPFFRYKKSHKPHYALKSSLKCSSHQAASDGTLRFNIPSTLTHKKIHKVCLGTYIHTQVLGDCTYRIINVCTICTT